MRTFRVGFDAAPPLRLLGATLVATACGWVIVRHVGRFPLALLCAAACLGVIGGSLRRGTTWERVLGPIVLGAGAAALGGRLLEEGFGYAAWPLFALALTAAVAGVSGERARWPLGLVVFAAILPLVRWVVLAEGGSASGALVAGALVAAAAWLTASLRADVVRDELPGEGPYRETWRSRNLN